MYESRNEPYRITYRYNRRLWRPKPSDLREIVAATVCRIYHVDARVLDGPSRGVARVALARQVAMYLAHVVGRIEYAEVGRLFGRDRTTVKHACAVIEDLRDNAKFDRTMDLLEGIVERLCDATKVEQVEVSH